jgi:phosphotransferase system enzyme I (PtsP)
MIEAPSIAFAAPALKGRADFLSVGTNDLMQYFYAADRGNPRVADRYDILSPAALRFLKQIQKDAAEADLPISICGDAAGRPLEAIAFVALGYDRLSMPASGIGPVKSMLAKLDAESAAVRIGDLLTSDKASVRADIQSFAKEAGIAP